MKWIIFGDDWNRHPSTTQHLCRQLLKQDTVYWINSIGMRTPSLCIEDIRRVASRLQRTSSNTSAITTPHPDDPKQVTSLYLSPYHQRATHRQFNQLQIKRYLRANGLHLNTDEPVVVLYANPLVAHYKACFPDHVTHLYLRLDDYANLPGVQATLVEPAEQLAQQHADGVIATARCLLPKQRTNLLYLPQGVDTNHFQLLAPPTQTKTLGFFGLFASWLDVELILDCASSRPDWQFEFRGPQQHHDARLAQLDNIQMLPGVPYSVLPEHITHWHAAWIPFERSTLTEHVNPLKLREYLAAGLPTASTWMPETNRSEVHAVETAADLCDWLDTLNDTEAKRAHRRHSILSSSWQRRAQTLRGFAQDCAQSR